MTKGGGVPPAGSGVPPSAETSPAVDAMVQLSFAVQLVLTRAAAAQELSVAQVRLLGILRDRTPSMASIADFLELDRSSVTGLIDRAERRGLVERRPSPTDARVTLVALTDLGRASGARVAADVSAALEHLLAAHDVRDVEALVRLAASVEARATATVGSPLAARENG